MWHQTENPESRQFGSFSRFAKSAFASTRHGFFENEDEDDDRKTQSGLLEQREYLRVGTIRIARASDLATYTDVLAGSA